MFGLLKKFLKADSEVIGIDLGTTNSVVAIMEDGAAKTIANAEGHRLLPSVVAFTKEGDILVGQPALRQMVTNPVKTIFSAKRFIGTDFSERKSEAFSVPFIARPDQNGRSSFEIDGRCVSPEEISAKVLAKLKASAEEYLGRSVTRAVITVPAYFNETQRQATKDAARIAGLEVEKIINEPTAAALAFAGQIEGTKTIAVYDFGGGTFDITIMKVTDESLEVIATGGDSHLGGDNIDEILITKAVQKFLTESGVDLTKEPQAMARLREASTKAKIELSSMAKTDINLPFLTVGKTGPLHFTCDLTRDEFERDIAGIVQKTIEPLAQTLKDAKMSKSDLDAIVLVGGSTRIPLVQREVEKFFGKAPLKHPDTDEIVAHGAAIQAAIVKGDLKVDLTDVTSLNLGVETIGDKMSVIIAKNTKVPVEIKRPYTTVKDNQKVVDIIVRQGQGSKASENKQLAMFVLEEIPPMKAGEPEITVTFTLDGNGILLVTAVDQDGRSQKIRVEDSGTLEKIEIERRIEEQNLPEKESRLLNAGRAELNEAIETAKAQIPMLPAGEQKAMAVLIEEGERRIQESVKAKDVDLVSREIQERLEDNVQPKTGT